MKPTTLSLTILLAWFAVILPVMAAAPDTQTGVAPPVTGTYPQLANTRLDSVIVSGTPDSIAVQLYPSLLSAQNGIYNYGLVAHDIDTITTYMHEHGWWYARATAAMDSSNGMLLRFDIDPGPPVYVGEIAIRGDSLQAGNDPGINTTGGMLFSRAVMQEITGTLIGRYASAGYPGITISPILTARADTMDVKLRIDAGIRARIDSIEVRGLKNTKSYIVQRELAGLTGRDAGFAVLEEASARVAHLQFLRMDAPPVVDYDAANRGVLVVNVSETRQGTFDGALGYQPSNTGDSGELVGSFLLDMPNMFGTGRASLIRWENLGNESEDLELAYTEPWLLNHPYDLALSFMQEERGIRGYTMTTMDASIARRLGNIRGKVGIRYEKTSADSLHSSSATGANIALIWSAVDNHVNPTEGYSYGFDWSTMKKNWRFSAWPDTRIDHVALDIDQYIPTVSRQTVAISVRYRNVVVPSDRLTSADRYWLGGTSSIRGYAEQLLPAVKAAWTNIEYRFITGETSRVFLFTDMGYLIDRRESNGIIQKHTRTVNGYGFGIRLQSRAGTLGFDYGLGRGDTITGGKLHISLTSDF